MGMAVVKEGGEPGTTPIKLEGGDLLRKVVFIIIEICGIRIFGNVVV